MGLLGRKDWRKVMAREDVGNGGHGNSGDGDVVELSTVAAALGMVVLVRLGDGECVSVSVRGRRNNPT